ncbi:MAG: PadR family transcriptional regulator [Actinomycetia bacterium]|nr:PadR family transcriptional regulator [Actinomycetes bacterium]
MRERFHDRDRKDRDRGEFGFGRRGGPHHGGRRTRRGDIRVALLAGLSDGPAHGYELIQRLSDRTGGRWKPSPGSVYPTLQLLEDAGFVSSSQQDTKRVYSITEAGQAELKEKMAAAGGTPPWMDPESAGSHDDLRKAVGQLIMATKQIGMSDNQAQVDATVTILNDARKKVYQLLAEA